MKIKLDALHLTILAALGLELACAVRPAGSEDSAGDGDGDGDTSTDTNTNTDTGEVIPHECVDPEPIMQAGTEIPSGFVQCEDGFIHRAEAVECVEPQGADSESCALEEFGSCQTAADCVEQAHGRCVLSDFGGCGCEYGCASDADCNDGFICACAGVTSPYSTCIPGDCASDSECGEGLCGLSSYEGCCGTNYKTACASPDEACHVDSECGSAPCDPNYPEGGDVMYQCSENGGDDDAGWTCSAPGWCNCDCGRPFFVDGDARVAPVVARGEWSATIAADLSSVDESTRRELAAYWAQIGQFEHAAVASFARFGLQLTSLGAPPRLVRENQRALIDEIEHARVAFGLASAYAGAPLGPGGLDVSGALDGQGDLRAIVEGLIVEACVGETLSALEVREAAAQALDPVVAALLDQIADDEWRHAQLGWRSLAWILAGADVELRRFALATLDTAARAVGQSAGPAVHQRAAVRLRRHGVLDEALRDQVRSAGLEAVISPCVEALREQIIPPAARGVALAC